MKKLFLCVCLLGFTLLLSGCEVGETNLQKFCKEIDPDIKMYEANSMNYDSLIEKLKAVSSSYCVGEDESSHLCTNIKELKPHKDHFQEKQDCTKGFYTSSKEAQELCISANKLADEMNGKVDEVEHAEISTHIDMECQMILEK